MPETSSSRDAAARAMTVEWLPDRRAGIHLVALALLVAIAFQGSRGLYETTEGRYAEVARAMSATGDLWTPRLEGQPHWTKPPLAYWLIAAGITVLGPNAWGVRMPNALAFVVIVFAVAGIGRVLWGRREGWAAGVIHATALGPVVAMSNVSTDTFLALWAALLVLTYWRAVRASQRDLSPFRRPAGVAGALSGTATGVESGHRSRVGADRWVFLLWLFTGLGFLTKGPPSLLTLAAILIFQTWQRGKGRPVPRLFQPWGILMALAVGLGWYVAVVLEHPGLWSYFLGGEVIDRIASDRFGRHPEWYKPFVVYLPPLLLGLGGWIAYWPRLVKRATKRRPDRAQERDQAWWRLRRMIRVEPENGFLLLWLLLPLVILSISRSRLPLYILPFFPVVTLLTARGLARAFEGVRLRPTILRTAWGLALLLMAAKAISAHIPSSRDMSWLHEEVTREARAMSSSSRMAPRVFLIDTHDMYGLQFYFRGRLPRMPGLEAIAGKLGPGERVLYLVRGPSGAGGGTPGVGSASDADQAAPCGLEVAPVRRLRGFSLWEARAGTGSAGLRPDSSGQRRDSRPGETTVPEP